MRTQQTACEGKTKFKTAKQASRLLKFERPTHSSGLSPYLCPYCHYYHLGNHLPGHKKHYKREKFTWPK